MRGLGEIFERFAAESPVTVMVRVLLEKALAAEKLDELFEKTAKVQYTRELLFSTVVNLMLLVVCRLRPSVGAAYKAQAKEIGVSRQAVYDKLNRTETAVSAALVRYTAQTLKPVTEQLGGKLPELLPGYTLKILDGNYLAPTEHRLEALKSVGGAAMPGMSLVVLEPAHMLAVNIFPSEDGYTNERVLFEQVLETVCAQEVWLADRNMSTNKFLFGIEQKNAYFIIRQHGSLPMQALEELRQVGRADKGQVFEQKVSLSYEQHNLIVRRVLLRLDQPTSDGETQIAVLTNLPQTTATGVRVAQLYRERWTVERLFQVITQTLDCEIKSLGYPKAALLSFSMALVAYNILSVVKTALRAVHGVGKIEAGLSDYYLAEEIQGTYRGMMIAIPPQQWTIFSSMELITLCDTLRQLATFVELKALSSTPRQAKKKQPKRHFDKSQPHVSTARLLYSKQHPS